MLMTYKTFTTPLEFIVKLIQRYHVPVLNSSEEYTKNTVRPIQLRGMMPTIRFFAEEDLHVLIVVRVIKQMIDDHSADLHEKELNLLKVFVRGIMEKSELYVTLRNSFAAQVIRK